MTGGKVSKVDAVRPDGRDEGWGTGARLAVSAAILFHATGAVAAALAWPPSSELERAVADRFAPYYQAADQGYAYRYYAPEPGPTPVVTATVRYADGRPEKVVRLPARGVQPRLRYQRQLALAAHLTGHFEEARQLTGDGSESPLARSFARHVAWANPGFASVSLYTRLHLVPPRDLVREAVEHGRPVDIDAEDFYTAPERIGEYPCDGS